MLILSVKTQDTAAALASVRHMEVGSALYVQNGIKKNAQLAEAFGADAVLGAISVIAAAIETNGAANYFMEKAANMSGQQCRVISSSAIAALQAYDWPGNVRELRNVIERLLIMAPGETDKPIGRKLLPPEIEGKAPAVVTRSVDEDVLNLPLRKAREAFERNYLSAQVTRFGGNVSKTAEFVGMERSALHRKLKTLGVENANN